MKNTDFLKTKKKWIIILIPIIVIAYYLVNKNNHNNGNYVQPEIRSIEEVVDASGTLGATQITNIYSPTKGVIKQIYVKNGDKVKQGDKLLEIQSTATDQEKAVAYAALTTANVSLKNAEAAKLSLQYQLELARQGVINATNSVNAMDENLTNQKNNPSTGKSYTEAEKLSIKSSLISSEQNFKTLEKQYLSADGSIASARASVNSAKIAYDATRNSLIKSQIDGTVYNLKKNIGDSVVTKEEGESLLVLANIEELTVSFYVSEFQISDISIGQTAEISLDALPGIKIPGIVSGLDTVGTSQLGTVKYGVIIRLKPSPEDILKIRPSMSANVKIITNLKESALVIPRSAVKFDKNEYTVIKKNNGKEVLQTIKIGLHNADSIEVIEGLTRTDLIKRVYDF